MAVPHPLLWKRVPFVGTALPRSTRVEAVIMAIADLRLLVMKRTTEGARLAPAPGFWPIHSRPEAKTTWA
jgi:hypothetical protein